MNNTNQAETAISFSGIKKSYGNFIALHNIDLDIPPGELFGFLGPNGAGKTTLLRILAGIIKPSDGTVRIKGIDLHKEPETAKAKIGYVPDRPYLYEKLTPIEYFEFMAGLYSVPVEKAIERGREMLNLFGLENWKDEMVESFSHGMKQKVAMSASMIHDPDIYVVDEPTVGLDPKSVKLAKTFFKDLTQRGKTVFLTTHTLSVAEDLCDRIGIINHGKIVTLGTMQQLKVTQAEGSDLEAIFLKITEEEQQEQPLSA